MVSSAAMMSARGTITSSTRSSPTLSRLASINRSCGDSSRLCRSLSSMTSSRLSRMAAALPSPRSICASRLRMDKGALSSSATGASVMGCCSRGFACIGIVDAELIQNLGLERLHHARGARRLVIVAEQMQHAVDGQVQRVIGEALLLRARLLLGHAVSDGDVAEILVAPCRERQHVGGLVLAAEGQVQLLERAVVGQKNGQRTFGMTAARKAKLGGALHARAEAPLPAPFRLLDHERHAHV